MKFDVVVCGAGSAGCITAIMLTQKQQLNVALIDRKPHRKIGRKVCGDAIAEYHFKMVQKELDIPFPRGEELQKTILGLDMYSPDQQGKVRLGSGHKGFIINRHLFGQRLLGYTLDAGVTVFDNTQVQDLILNNNQITGVIVKRKKDKKNEEIKAKVVVDATGVTGVLRKKLTPELASGIEVNISEEDLWYAYREIRLLKHNLPEDEYLKIYFSKEFAPGGYIWLFPRGDEENPSVNTGVGITSTSLPPSPKERFYQYVKRTPLFKESSLITSGAGLIPIRRPNKSFVTNGLVLIGDAGWQVNPVNAGGLGTTLEAGIMAANAISKAIELDNLTPKGLWNYNVT
ncbi:MAG: geranylgeranyl reductase family protein, partial [Promethearchaeota archaeon]